MTVGWVRIELCIEGSSSLKERRMFLHSIKARLRNRFNVAVAQIDDEDKWQKAVLAVATVADNRQQVNRVLSQVMDFCNGCPGLVVIHQEMELV